MLSKAFQEDMPLQMFVFPVLDGAKLPAAFVEHAAEVDHPLSVPSDEIDKNRERWIEEWTSIVLG